MPIILQKKLDEVYRLNSTVLGIAGESDDLFIVAVIEIFTNIVKHAHECDTCIKVQCSVNEYGKKQVQFIYGGAYFRPDSIKLPDCFSQVNGFGLFLIEKICSSVTYDLRDDGFSLITLTAK